eukprot:CAMPEP_0184871366 /NCGR_PEP_ID=MMETSP0580-20130426/40677_1 /TAXON_ID=1118495 /ORGANISM="Dactyliosolen fragilissimus" /LENGTH=481 /DNA_ID=CAMNT_0027374015 /DNA_START=129 /DNA_END=1574 /DNA_ORIENTATION=-
MSYFITAISNGGASPEQSLVKLARIGSNNDKDFADMFKFEVPSLMVGTLDSLMKLSDDMGKTDAIVESIVRKIEKTGKELSAEARKASELTVGGVPAQRYIQQFAWDFAKYPNRRPLKELVSLITGGVSDIDEELKQLGTAFADKQGALAEAKRNKAGNLMVAELNDVLTQDVMRNVTIHDTDYLKTMFIAIPKGSAEAFLTSIESLGEDLVGYGGPDWSRNSSQLGTAVKYGSLVDRHRKRGSPVVPGSVQLIKEDNDSQLYTVTILKGPSPKGSAEAFLTSIESLGEDQWDTVVQIGVRGSPVVPVSVQLIKEDNDSQLYTVTILKGQYEAGYYEGDEFVSGTKVDFESGFIKACREKRFVVREFVYDPDQASKSAMAIEQLQVEVDSMRSGLTRWCKTHYGEAYVAWMHIKVIRVFVESVLRYGLPVDFTAVLYKVINSQEDGLTQALDKEFGSDENTKEADDDGEEYHDFVLLKFAA